MNKERRYRINNMVLILEECVNALAEIAEEEEQVYENMGEHFSGTERFQRVEETYETLTEAQDVLDNLVNLLSDAVAI